MPAHMYSTHLWAWQIFVIKWRTKWMPQYLLGSFSSHWGPVPLSPQLPESIRAWALWPRKGALLWFTALSGRFLRDLRGYILSGLPYAVHIAVWAPWICNSTTALRVLCVWGKPAFLAQNLASDLSSPRAQCYIPSHWIAGVLSGPSQLSETRLNLESPLILLLPPNFMCPLQFGWTCFTLKFEANLATISFLRRLPGLGQHLRITKQAPYTSPSVCSWVKNMTFSLEEALSSFKDMSSISLFSQFTKILK